MVLNPQFEIIQHKIIMCVLKLARSMKEESLSSFLTSLPKFHEFELSLMKNSTSKALGDTIKSGIE